MVAKERKQSKAKRQALWTRASAYSASKRPDRALADVQNALSLSLDDPGAYIRAAKISADSHRYAQAVEYLNIAEQKLQHCAPSRQGKLAKKVEKQRRVFKKAFKICDISRLPDEILLLIFQHVSTLNTILFVCNKWKRIVYNAPSMWRHLVLGQGLTEAQCIYALNNYTVRSNRSLETVEMPRNFFKFKTLNTVAILRESAATLRHLKMPSLDQRICYDQLYCHCPNLKSLDVNTESVDPFDGLNDDPLEMPLFPQTGDLPFQLEVFKGDRNISYRLPVPSMDKLRVIHYLDPSDLQLPNPDPTACLDYLKAISKLADTLEELAILHPLQVANTIDEADLDDGEMGENDEDQIEFKRLKSLQGWVITRAASRFKFPVLEVAKLICNDSIGWISGFELPDFFKHVPLLRKLDLDMGDIQPEDAVYLIDAVRHLVHLEDLTLEHEDWHDIKFEDILAPAYEWDRTEQACVPFVPCRRLTRLAFRDTRMRLTLLIKILAMRNYLALGHTYQDAQHMAQKNYGSPPLIKLGNPFRRETTPSPTWPADENFKIANGSGATRFNVCRLQTFELLQVESRDGVFEHFDEFADKVNIRYKMYD